MAIEAGCWRHQTAKRAVLRVPRHTSPLIARRTWPSARHAGAGGARNRAIRAEISANI
jgi:hypothetical protein